MQNKHIVGLTLVIVLVISGVGLLNVSAQGDETAWLGVGVEDTNAGVVVREVVPDSPADDAGIEPGDVIRTVGRTRIRDAEHFVDLIQSFEPGDEVVIVVVRDGERLTKEVVLGERPDDLEPPGVIIEIQPPMMHGEMVLLGMTLLMTPEGIVVEAIDDDSPLADVGFEPGDVIVEIDGEPIAEMVPRAMLMLLDGGEVTFTVLRDDEEIEIVVDFDDLPQPQFDYQHGPVIVHPPQMDMLEIRQPLQLGVRFKTLTPEIAADEGLAVDEGALLVEVYGGTPAADAGLEAGDVITAVDDDLVDEEHTLADRLYAYEHGDEVALTVMRGDDELTLTATLGPNPRDMHIRTPMPVQPFAPGMQGRGHFFIGPGMMVPFGNADEWMDRYPRLGEWLQMLPFHYDGEFHFRFDFDGPGGIHGETHAVPGVVPDADAGAVDDGAIEIEIVPDGDGGDA